MTGWMAATLDHAEPAAMKSRPEGLDDPERSRLMIASNVPQ